MARTPKVVEDRREQIIDAAMRVFSQKGFTRATNKDVALEAGITPGLIYYYFESKEALLSAIIEERSPFRLITTLPADVFALPPQVFMRMMILRVLSIVEGENFIQLIKMLLPEMVHNPAMSTLAIGFFHRLLKFLESFLQKKLEDGELRHIDVSLTAQVFVGSVMGFVLRRQIIHDSIALQYTHEQLADAVLETFLKGIEPRS